MESEQELGAQQVIGNETATGSQGDGGDPDGVEGLAPAAGTDGPEAGVADADAAKAVAEDADEGPGHSDNYLWAAQTFSKAASISR